MSKKIIPRRTQEETLHAALDLLINQFLNATGQTLAKATLLDLTLWSMRRVHKQHEDRIALKMGPK